MQIVARGVLATFLCVGGAWGADAVVEGAASAARSVAAFETDDTLELKWDSGTHRWNMAWYTGADTWVGNDFNLSTISAYRAVEKIRVYTRSNWPNTRWDGFRVGIFNFSTVPGSRLWPTSGSGYFFKPSGLHGHVWVEIGIGWTCPSTAFVAAVEQFYNYPNCDPWTLDSNISFRGHSWQYLWGTWAPLQGYQSYRNVMVRAVVNNSTLGVAPSSVGRVKALYY